MTRLTRREEIGNCSGIWVQEGFANEGLQTWFNGYDEGYSAINKCADYEDAEEQGLLLKLPCKAGDTVYKPMGHYYEGTKKVKEPCIFKFKIRNITINSLDIVFSTETAYGASGVDFKTEDIGKTVFLNKEQAEEALRKMEGD